MPIFIWTNARNKKWRLNWLLNFMYNTKVQIKVIWNTHGLGKRSRNIKIYSEDELDFKTRSTIFPGIINFAQASHLIFVSGPFLENRVNFPGGVGEGAGGQRRTQCGLTVSWLPNALKTQHFIANMWWSTVNTALRAARADLVSFTLLQLFSWCMEKEATEPESLSCLLSTLVVMTCGRPAN